MYRRSKGERTSFGPGSDWAHQGQIDCQLMQPSLERVSYEEHYKISHDGIHFP